MHDLKHRSIEMVENKNTIHSPSWASFFLAKLRFNSLFCTCGVYPYSDTKKVILNINCLFRQFSLNKIS